jgi:chemotaxis response regulator CheB
MPGEVVKRGYADEVQPLNSIAERILYYVGKRG